MKIKVNYLKLRNFKGMRNLEVKFNGVTNIAGENGTGKTTIADAFSWLLFNKDSSDKTAFNIKTLVDGIPMRKAEHEVIGEIQFGSEKHVLRKVYKEKWVKPNGQAEEKFSGHETLYFWDEVPVTEKEYKIRVSSMCGGESEFKLLTSPSAFPSLPWTEQRRILFQMAGDYTDSEILSMNPDLAEVILPLLESRSIAELKKVLQSRKRKAKEDLDGYPFRIAEVMRALENPDDWSAIQASLVKVSSQITEIDAEISDLSLRAEKEAKGYNEIRAEIAKKTQAKDTLAMSIREGLSAKHHEALNKKMEARYELDRIESDLKNIDRDIDIKNQRIASLEEEKKRLLEEYRQINAVNEVNFLDEEFTCPTCGRRFEEDVVEDKRSKLLAKHNENKTRRLEENIRKGSTTADTIKELQADLEKLKVKKSDLQSLLTEKKLAFEALTTTADKAKSAIDSSGDAVASNPDYIKLIEEIRLLTEKMGTPPPAPDTASLNASKAALRKEVADLTLRLGGKKQYDASLVRKQELIDAQRATAQELAGIERAENAIMEFYRRKVALVEERINGMFSFVRFRMFNTQVNGEEVETCECLVDGVPYSDANTAGKIRAGLDIINALSRHKQIVAPIFIDNRESVNEIIDTESQIVNLIVSKDPTLVIN